MATANFLSQDEIDALLHGVDNGQVDMQTDKAFDGVVRAHDLTNQDRVVRARMPKLEMLNEHFAHNLRLSFFNMLRCSVQTTVTAVQVMPCADYLHSLPVPVSLNLIKINPLPGKALCVIDPRLVSVTVDNYFGGTGRPARIEGREFSLTETRVIQMILDQALKDLAKAWNPILPVDVEFLGTEVNPQFANFAGPREEMVVCGFHIELEGSSGTFHVVMPYDMLAPVRELLDGGVQSDEPERDDRWNSALREELKAAEITLSCTLSNTTISLRDLLQLKQGDIIPVKNPEKITLLAEDVPVFRGSFGVHNGNKAVKIGEMIKRPQNQR